MNQLDLQDVATRICKNLGLELVRRVGEGAFKETFEVRDDKGHRLAFKLRKAASITERDQREIDAMLRCNHPNIAQLVRVEFFNLSGLQFLVTIEEFLPGGTLGQKGIVTTAVCKEIGRELISALAHLAELNLVHRDIKPENVVFREDSRTPVITDFGVVRALADSSLTPTWAPLGPGTPFFSSPEQLNNQKDLIDWRSDQFSLGVTLSFARFGVHPYMVAGDSDARIVERVGSRDGPTKDFVARTKSAGLSIFVKMLASWPVDRFLTPSHLVDAWAKQSG